jgi:Mg/Co/Ni transporter MgtE
LHKDARDHDEHSVGRLMTQDVVTVRDDQNVEQVLDGLRLQDEIPDQTDRTW